MAPFAMSGYVRRATHAGTWYSSDPRALARQVGGWFADVRGGPNPGLSAVIGPHAGYTYCGRVLAHAYKHLDPAVVTRVVLLGPSHHFYARRSLLSSATSLETPFGELPVDRSAVSSLASSGLFDVLSRSEDEEEHSIEMHLPFIAYVASSRGAGANADLASSGESSRGSSPGGSPGRGARASRAAGAARSSSPASLGISVVPIVVGDLDSAEEARLGKLLEPLLESPGTVLAASTDFCHWGRRFGYVRRDPSLPIHASIEALDARGMAEIESGDPERFFKYEEATKNTICGRHAVGAVMHALREQALARGWGEKGAKRARFLAYDQSSKVVDPHDSSVSYASAIVA